MDDLHDGGMQPECFFYVLAVAEHLDDLGECSASAQVVGTYRLAGGCSLLPCPMVTVVDASLFSMGENTASTGRFACADVAVVGGVSAARFQVAVDCGHRGGQLCDYLRCLDLKIQV